MVEGARVTPTGGIIILVSRHCSAVTGDKFTTHGQKGVVTVMPNRLMLLLPSGDVAELVIGSTTLMKRGTVGQPMECYAYSMATFGTSMISDYTEVPNDTMRTEVVRDRTPSCHDNERNIFAHHCMMTLMQSWYVSFDRHQFTRATLSMTSSGPKSGRIIGGNVHLGKIEMQQMIRDGLSGCLEEFHITGTPCP